MSRRRFSVQCWQGRDGRRNGGMDGGMDRWRDRWMEGWMDGGGSIPYAEGAAAAYAPVRYRRCPVCDTPLLYFFIAIN